MDYSKLSDQQINAAVAMTFGEKIGQPVNGMQMLSIDGEYLCSTFDPCNNAADSWPIIEDKKICLAFDVFAEPQDGGAWVAQPAYGWERERVRNDNPLRAAMIVFLMMQESE